MLKRFQKILLLSVLIFFLGNILVVPLSAKAANDFIGPPEPTNAVLIGPPEPTNTTNLCVKTHDDFTNNLVGYDATYPNIALFYSKNNKEAVKLNTSNASKYLGLLKNSLMDYGKYQCGADEFENLKKTFLDRANAFNAQYKGNTVGPWMRETNVGEVNTAGLVYTAITDNSADCTKSFFRAEQLYKSFKDSVDTAESLINTNLSAWQTAVALVGGGPVWVWLTDDIKKKPEIEAAVNAMNSADTYNQQLLDELKNLKDKNCDQTKYQDIHDRTFALDKRYMDLNTKIGREATSLGQIVAGGIENTIQQFSGADCGCGKATYDKNQKWFQEPICLATCSMSKTLGKFVQWCWELLDKVSSISYHQIFESNIASNNSLLADKNPLQIIGVAHAGIVDDLNASPGVSNQRWIFSMWNFCLSIVNIVVIAILIFLALVNILRIQVDTYALKKILPLLILGVVLANFSMLICRMIVDFSDVLTRTIFQAFGAVTKDEIGWQLADALTINNVAAVGIAGVGLLVGFFIPGVLLVAFIISAIIVLAPALLMLVLAFLLYIRIAVIYVLAAISPLAFMMLILPSTQSLFKQWWSQFAKWVFMAPAVYLLLCFAILPSGTTFAEKWKLIPYMITIAMLYFAVQVPFKLGGAVMAAWGGAGKFIAKKAGGWAWRGGNVAMQKYAGWSPLGKYQGWINGAKRRYEGIMGESAGEGERFREKVLGGPRFEKGKLRWGRESLMMTEGEIKTRDTLRSEAKNMGGANEKQLRDFHDTNMRNEDFDKARQSYLGLAAQGNATETDQKNFIDLAKKKNRLSQAYMAESLVGGLSRESDGEHLLVSSLTTGERGKIVDRDEGEMMEDYIKNFGKLPGATAADKSLNLDKMVRLHLTTNGKDLIDPSEFKTKTQQALANVLAQLTSQHGLVQNAGKLTIDAATKYTITPINQNLEQLKQEIKGLTEGQIAEAIKIASQFSQNPHKLAIPINVTPEYAYRVHHINKNWDGLKGLMNNEINKLISQMPDAVKNEAAGKAPIEITKDIIVKMKEKIHLSGTPKQQEKAKKDIEDLYQRSKVYQGLQENVEKGGKDKTVQDLIKKGIEEGKINK